MVSYWVLGYQVNAFSNCLSGTGSSDHTESSSSTVGKSSLLSESISDGGVSLKVNHQWPACWGANLSFFTLVWMQRWDPVSPCSPWGSERPQLLISGKCILVSKIDPVAHSHYVIWVVRLSVVS